VNARIVNLEEFAKIKKDEFTLKKVQQAEIYLTIGNMIKGTASSVLREVRLGHGPKRDFNIFFNARNGLYVQLLRLRKVDSKWVSAIKVERNNETVFEQVAEKFPRDEEGKINWN